MAVSCIPGLLGTRQAWVGTSPWAQEARQVQGGQEAPPQLHPKENKTLVERWAPLPPVPVSLQKRCSSSEEAYAGAL